MSDPLSYLGISALSKQHAHAAPSIPASTILHAASAVPSSLVQPDKNAALKLQNSLTFGKKLLAESKATKDSTVQWVRRVRTSLFDIFGKDAVIVKDLDAIIKEVQTKGLTKEQFTQRLAELECLVNCLNNLGAFPLKCPISATSRTPSSKDVFIIHGHDELNTRRLIQLLQGNFGLNPVAMLAKPGMSRPLTEKFEDEARTCSFAFALFTTDDEVVKTGQAYKQARPNVIYEVGWFIGRLGRSRVVLILKSGTRIHSDLDGVSQIHFSENVEDKYLEIQKELAAASMIFPT